MLSKLAQSIRQNHAIEHATVSLLSQADASRQLVGRSDWTGFNLYGSVSTEAVVRAAREGLALLKAGNGALAVHPRCGTNLAVSVILGGAAAYAVATQRKESRLMRLNNSLVATIAALLIARPLGVWAQRYLTTTDDLSDVQAIGEVRREERGGLVIHHVSVVR